MLPGHSVHLQRDLRCVALVVDSEHDYCLPWQTACKRVWSLIPVASQCVKLLPGGQVDAPEDADGYIHRVGRTARYNVSRLRVAGVGDRTGNFRCIV